MKTNKKLVILVVIFLSAVLKSTGQTITAPVSNGATTQTKAPNGYGHKTLRSLYFIPQSELTGFNGTVAINSLTFNLLNGRSATHGSIAGTIKIYLQNTTDTSNQKPYTFSDIIAPMTLVYDGEYNIPATNNPFSITNPFSIPFNYTESGLYVAIDYSTPNSLPTTLPAQAATYTANNTLSGSCYSTSSSDTAISNTLTASSFRPELVFSSTNLSANSIQHKTGLNLSPNPASSFVRIENNSLYSLETVELIDLNGRIIKSISPQASTIVEMDISDIQEGIYLVVVKTSHNYMTTKMIVHQKH